MSDYSGTPGTSEQDRLPWPHLKSRRRQMIRQAAIPYGGRGTNLLALADPVAEDASTAGIISLRRINAARFGVVGLFRSTHRLAGRDLAEMVATLLAARGRVR